MDHRQWFDQLASTWDAMFTADIIGRLEDIISQLDIQPGSRVLDIGCGTGVLVPLLLKKVSRPPDVVALDISLEMLSRAQEKGQTVQFLLADGENLPLLDSSFDWVICNAVFPHFLDKESALREIHRVLKDGGQLLICHPKGRETVNATHRNLGDPVCNDQVPSEGEIRRLLSDAALDHTVVLDEPDRYVVLTSRSAHEAPGETE
jgi:ubiquinone/menaquinone biosynthesis C-methylase UbiE